MNKNAYNELIPGKGEGKNNEIEENVTYDSRTNSLDKFNSAVERLLNINNWQDTAKTSGASAEFKLVDISGDTLFDTPKEGDYIQIDVPGPGPGAGKGFDWVCIEKIIHQRDPNAENEMVGFKVRACSDPTTVKDEIAHFFTDSATSTFVIERKGNTVYSKYFGRNEVINTDTNITDKIRNSLIGIGAKLGFSEIQWKSLIKGFLE